MTARFRKISLVLLLLSFSVSAQTIQSSSSQENPAQNERQIRKVRSDAENTQQRQRAFFQRHTFFKQKRNKEQQKRLLPNAEDLNLYQGFLQQPKTGIIRLADDIGCDSNAFVLRADEECLGLIPGGSFYSFREREYSSSAFSDLRLKNGLLITDGVFSQNILVSLGDIPLENLTLNSDGMKFLSDFVPETEIKEATNQYVKLTKGIKIGKFEYLKVYPAFANTTYAMRLVAYKGKLLTRLHGGFLYNILSDDDRADLILAFRIIRKEKDNITLVWKELERRKAPKIIRPKRKD